MDAPRIIAATGCPSANVLANWPLIQAALTEFGIDDELTQIAAAGTVAVETGRFIPIKEMRADSIKNPGIYVQQNRYWSTGYYGRGFIQLSLQPNYHHFGVKLGYFLEDTPDLALDPTIAARVLGLYFQEHGIQAAANAKNWLLVRQEVNGGTNGLDKFKIIVNKLLQGM
jgi:predicted chitinase